MIEQLTVIGSACSGIGLLEFGLERAGLGKVKWQVEKDAWCRKVLKKHWPDADRAQRDVTSAAGLTAVDVFCAGFPCQPVSVAGKRRAHRDERWLWPDIARIAKEVRPAICVFENVLGLRSAGLRGVLADVADLGFDAEWTCLSAFELGANHFRKRIFIVCTDSNRVLVRDEPGWLGRACESARAAIPGYAVEALCGADPGGVRRLESSRMLAELRGWSRHAGWSLGTVEAVDDGRAGGLARGDIGRARKALGNAVVVACAEVVGRAIARAISTRGEP